MTLAGWQGESSCTSTAGQEGEPTGLLGSESSDIDWRAEPLAGDDPTGCFGAT